MADQGAALAEDAAAAASQEETLAYRHLLQGFKGTAADNAAVDSSPPPQSILNTLEADDNKRVLVHFLDPGATTSISNRSTHSAGSTTQQQQQQQQRQSLNERFGHIFQKVYHNRLQAVSYQDARSQTTQTIAHVHVKCKFLESQVDLLQTHEDDLSVTEQQPFDENSTNDNHNAAAADAMSVDSSATVTTNAWHTRPYCYVYFVTNCQTVEEYRTKVKPAIQVFLSQLDDLYQRQAMQLSSAGGSGNNNADEETKPSYLLVYCPSRAPGSPPILPDSDPDAANTGRPFSLANRFRQRMSTTSADGSVHTAADDAASTAASETAHTTPTSASSAAASEAPFNPLQVLTKVEKEVARRMAQDYPQGTVVTLTTLGNDYTANFGNSSLKPALEELERCEWNALLAALSKTVVHGFNSITQNLLHALRGMSNTSQDDARRQQPDVGHYFLLKESLAFTYEQMNLPQEALLQYNELRVFLPDLQKAHDAQHPPDMTTPDALADVDGLVHSKKQQQRLAQLPQATPVWQVPQATTRSTFFRKHIQALHYDDYHLIAPAMERYLWERETSLLFQVRRPGQDGRLQVLQRSLEFCQALYEYQGLQQQSGSSEEDGATKTKTMEWQLEEWAFGFCWDLKRAAQQYLLHLQSEKSRLAPELARHLCHVVAFARLRFLKLAQANKKKQQQQPAAEKAGDSNKPVTSPRHKDLAKPWDSWNEATAGSTKEQDNKPATAAKSSKDESGQAFLRKAFGDTTTDSQAQQQRVSFLQQYATCLQVYISLCNFCARHRLAARCTLELVDVHVELQQVPEAAQALQTVSKLYHRDGWNALHFWVHFRLAGFRRTLLSSASNVLTAREYLATLVQCFSRHVTAQQELDSHHYPTIIAPPKALEVLCQDFESIMAALSASDNDDESANKDAAAPPRKEATFSNFPVFETAFKLPEDDDNTSGLNSKKPQPHHRHGARKLPRKVFAVGDTIALRFVLKSHLPRPVDDVTISAALVPHKAYTAAQKHKKPLSRKDVVYTIRAAAQQPIQPGENELQLTWIPAVHGQFVVAQVTLSYKATHFVYTYDKMKDLGFWMDVLPMEPTQSLQVKPVFLVPGHEQQLRIEFHSGEDHVESGELNLVCSPGLALLPPSSVEAEDGAAKGAAEKKWVSNLKFPIASCPQGQTQTFVVDVTGVSTTGQSFDEMSEVSGAVPTVHAKISTAFCCGKTLAEKDLYLGEHQANTVFAHELESVIPSLGDPALSVDHVSVHPFHCAGRVILSVSAKCHVPAPFCLQSWKLHLPSYLEEDTENDGNSNNNAAVAGTMLVKGETVSFAFVCKTLDNKDEKEDDDEGSSEPQQQPPALVVELKDEHGSIFYEQLLLRFKKPLALPAMKLPPQVHEMVVQTHLSADQGTVGKPVQVTYSLNTSPLAEWKRRNSDNDDCRIWYTLDTHNEAWLVAGNTKGQVIVDKDDDAKEWQLVVHAIPTGPGALATLPFLELQLEGGGLEQPYPVVLPFAKSDDNAAPCGFQARLASKHSTIAFAT